MDGQRIIDEINRAVYTRALALPFVWLPDHNQNPGGQWCLRVNGGGAYIPVDPEIAHAFIAEKIERVLWNKWSVVLVPAGRKESPTWMLVVASEIANPTSDGPCAFYQSRIEAAVLGLAMLSAAENGAPS